MNLERLNNRIAELEGEIEKASQALQSNMKERENIIAQTNALQGALQQCQLFAQELDNEASGDLDLPDAPEPSM